MQAFIGPDGLIHVAPDDETEQVLMFELVNRAANWVTPVVIHTRPVDWQPVTVH